MALSIMLTDLCSDGSMSSLITLESISDSVKGPDHPLISGKTRQRIFQSNHSLCRWRCRRRYALLNVQNRISPFRASLRLFLIRSCPYSSSTPSSLLFISDESLRGSLSHLFIFRLPIAVWVLSGLPRGNLKSFYHIAFP